MSMAEVVRYHMGTRAVVWVAVVFDRVTGRPIKWSDAYDSKSSAEGCAAAYEAEWGPDYTVSTIGAYWAE